MCASPGPLPPLPLCCQKLKKSNFSTSASPYPTGFTSTWGSATGAPLHTRQLSASSSGSRRRAALRLAASRRRAGGSSSSWRPTCSASSCCSGSGLIGGALSTLSRQVSIHGVTSEAKAGADVPPPRAQCWAACRTGPGRRSLSVHPTPPNMPPLTPPGSSLVCQEEGSCGRAGRHLPACRGVAHAAPLTVIVPPACLHLPHAGAGCRRPARDHRFPARHHKERAAAARALGKVRGAGVPARRTRPHPAARPPARTIRTLDAEAGHPSCLLCCCADACPALPPSLLALQAGRPGG